MCLHRLTRKVVGGFLKRELMVHGAEFSSDPRLAHYNQRQHSNGAGIGLSVIIH